MVNALWQPACHITHHACGSASPFATPLLYLRLVPHAQDTHFKLPASLPEMGHQQHRISTFSINHCQNALLSPTAQPHIKEVKRHVHVMEKVGLELKPEASDSTSGFICLPYPLWDMLHGFIYPGHAVSQTIFLCLAPTSGLRITLHVCAHMCGGCTCM